MDYFAGLDISMDDMRSTFAFSTGKARSFAKQNSIDRASDRRRVGESAEL